MADSAVDPASQGLAVHEELFVPGGRIIGRPENFSGKIAEICRIAGKSRSRFVGVQASAVNNDERLTRQFGSDPDVFLDSRAKTGGRRGRRSCSKHLYCRFD